MSHALRFASLVVPLSLLAGCELVAGIEERHGIATVVDSDASADAPGGLAAEEQLGAKDGGAASDSAKPPMSADAEVPDATSPPGPAVACRCGAAGCGTCPADESAPLANLGFRIDRYEVTRAAYDAFVAANVAAQSATKVPAECAWNTSYARPSASGSSELPVVGVDWCDAWAYCAWAGKRLCGAVGGGAASPSAAQRNNPARDEWYHVCSEGKPPPSWPYGTSFDPEKCGGPGSKAGGELRKVGENKECHGSNAPYQSIFDMAGNASEWVDACNGTAGAADVCAVRGGTYLDRVPNPSCDKDELVSRHASSPTIGFRCCKTGS